MKSNFLRSLLIFLASFLFMQHSNAQTSISFWGYATGTHPTYVPFTNSEAACKQLTSLGGAGLLLTPDHDYYRTDELGRPVRVCTYNEGGFTYVSHDYVTYFTQVCPDGQIFSFRWSACSDIETPAKEMACNNPLLKWGTLLNSQRAIKFKLK